MKSTHLLILSGVIILASCSPKPQPQIGDWRAVIVTDTTNSALNIPFNLDLKKTDDGTYMAEIRNADEVIQINEIQQNGDSLVFHLPVFEGTIKVAFTPKRMEGTYTHRGSGRSWSTPFYADAGISDRFPDSNDPVLYSVDGRWEVIMSPDSPRPEKQIGEFKQTGRRVTGSFLTTTGDYRFLDGKISGSQLMLSAFDGAHSLIFRAEVSREGTLENGIFSGGPGWKGNWRAERNDTVSLPDPTTLTYLKPGYKKLEFSFPNLEGKMVSLEDPQYKGKPMIVQIMGSWCPNCMDEARFFTGLFDKYHHLGLELIALCYESDDFNKSVKAIERFKDGLGANYTFLYAGVSNKRKASETLPMLNRILSFPTSIFIDKNGDVKEIFTGFSGPGTGNHFTQLTEQMEELVKEMLND